MEAQGLQPGRVLELDNHKGFVCRLKPFLFSRTALGGSSCLMNFEGL